MSTRKSNVLKKMKQLQLSHKQVAAHAMLPVTVFTLWLNAKAVVPHNKLLRIADLLDLEVDDIVQII